MIEKKFEIVNVLNHNTLLCKVEKTQQTYVFFGKGIGFKRKKGETFHYDKSVENTLLALEYEEANQYKELLEHVQDKKLVNVVQEIVQEANKFFDHGVNGNLNLTLLDHLNFAIERQKQNYQMNYPFLHELKFIYPKEYEFSAGALKYINEQMKETAFFDNAELGFLVLHIHAAISNETVSKVLMNNEILFECTQIIEEVSGSKVERQSIYYSRFTKHLEYAVSRYKNGIHLQNVLLDQIKETCSEDFKIAKKINEHLTKKHRVNLDEDEIGYLTLHIYNLRNRID